MAHLITHPAAIDFLQEDEGRRNLNELLADIDLQFEEYSILSNSPFLGQPISQMEVRGQGAFIIVAIRQFDGGVIAHPDNSTILQQGDTVILLGHRGDIPNFARRYALRREMRYRRSSWQDIYPEKSLAFLELISLGMEIGMIHQYRDTYEINLSRHCLREKFHCHRCF
jgi:voltage-gated potassium channel